MIPVALAGAISVFAMGLIMLLALRLVYAGRVPITDPIYSLVSILGWVLVAMGWLGLLLAFNGVLGVILFVSSLVVAGIVLHHRYIAQSRVHLTLLAMAVDKKIPLPACIDALAVEQGGLFGARAREFADDLRSGMPLPDAIAASSRVLPRWAELASRVGMACNRLGPAMREEILSHQTYSPVRRALGARIMYVCLVLGVMPAVLTFLTISILPAYLRIFSDFQIELPETTQFVFDLINVPSLRTICLYAVLVGIVLLIYALNWYAGGSLSWPPGLRRLFVRFDRAAILRALAFSTEQRQPLEPMIDVLARSYPSWSIRRRLRRTAKRIQDGQDWISSLQSQSLLGKADAVVLVAAQRANNLPWAMREMAESNERRLIRRLEFLAQLASVVVILLLAAIVLIVCVACIQPLTKLIMNLA